MADQSYHTRYLRRAYTGFLSIDLYEVTVSDGEKTVTVVREVHDHGHGASVLPYDATRGTALLVRQMRMPVHVAGGDGLILEAAAGLCEPRDSGPLETAEREAREELGYAVHDLDLVTKMYPIPGLVTEQMSIFLARYTPDDKIAGDRALDEDEVLTVEEWPLDRLWEAFEAGELVDAKAVVALQGLRLRRPELFAA